MTSPGSQFQVTSVPAGTVSDDGEKKSLPTFTVSGPGVAPPPPLEEPPPPPVGAPGVTPMTPAAGLEEDPAQAAATATAMNAAITVRFRIVPILRWCKLLQGGSNFPAPLPLGNRIGANAWIPGADAGGKPLNFTVYWLTVVPIGIIVPSDIAPVLLSRSYQLSQYLPHCPPAAAPRHEARFSFRRELSVRARSGLRTRGAAATAASAGRNEWGAGIRSNTAHADRDRAHSPGATAARDRWAGGTWHRATPDRGAAAQPGPGELHRGCGDGGAGISSRLARTDPARAARLHSPVPLCGA